MDPMQYWLIVGFLLVGGSSAVLGARMDWDFFMEGRRARPIVGLFGRTGARVLYGVLGVLFIVGGVVMLLIGPAALS
jgi:hypothetical protein